MSSSGTIQATVTDVIEKRRKEGRKNVTYYEVKVKGGGYSGTWEADKPHVFYKGKKVNAKLGSRGQLVPC